MKEFVLLCIMVGVFLYGYSLMKKIDIFLEENTRNSYTDEKGKDHSLCDVQRKNKKI